MKREHYRNGQEIDLVANGCDGCNPAVINGLFCHEQGCPDEWRDRKLTCKDCGTSFPVIRKHPSCNGQRISKCPFCRPKRLLP